MNFYKMIQILQKKNKGKVILYRGDDKFKY